MAKKIDKWPPSLSADKAFDVTDKIYKSYGKSVSVDLMPQILECSRKSSYFIKRLIALQTFKLATVDKNVLTLTPLALRIVAPVSVVEKHEAKLESIASIKILKDLSSRYPGFFLPEDGLILNLIRREYDVSEESAKEWLDFVKKSSLGMKDGVLITGTFTNPTVPAGVAKYYESTKSESENPLGTIITENETEKMLKIPLTGDRYILIPKDLKDSEAEYFNKWYEMWKVLHEQK